MDEQLDIQAQLKRRKAEHDSRPHCVVNRSTLRMTLKSLVGVFPEAGSDGVVTVGFNGRMLSFVCHGVELTVPATGQPWQQSYELLVGNMADAEPMEFRNAEVEIGFWQSYLEIDGVPWILEKDAADGAGLD